MSTDEELKEYLRLLSDKGPQVVIITSVPVHDEPHKTSVYAYNRQGNRYWKVTCPYLPAHYPGTGDTFTSVITGSLDAGRQPSDGVGSCYPVYSARNSGNFRL